MNSRQLALVILLALTAQGTALFAQGTPLKPVAVSSKPAAAASNEAILANGILYTAAQSGQNPDGSLPQNFRDEAAQTFANLRNVLRAAQMDFANLASVHVYLTRQQDVEAMNDAYWKAIGSHPPARTVLVVAALPAGAHIQVNAIAAQDLAHRTAVTPEGWPHGPHTDPAALLVGDVLYTSARDGSDPVTGKLPTSYADEVKQALDNVSALMKTAHMSMANVVWVNPYMSSAQADLTAANTSGPIAHNGQPQPPQANVMNKVYATYFEFGNTPGRGTIQTVSLPENRHIVFTCIAGADLAKRKSIRPRNMPPSPTASPGILYGDTYYMSAKSGFIPDQGIVTQDIDLQLRQTMRNLLDDLQEAEMDFTDVVSSTVYVRHIRDADRVHTLYSTFFKGPLPARTTLQNSEDQKTATGEQISFIAVRQPKH
jgi:enamine deaminase RidA (YjgF/YER057c/UK114 family)